MRWVLPVVLALGCASPDAFTDREIGLLETFLLPETPAAIDNPIAEDFDAISLGEDLFFDRALSGPLLIDSDLGSVGETGRVSCADCHDVTAGGSDHRSPGPTSLGADQGTRNAPGLFNAAFRTSFGWEGKKKTMWKQMEVPLQANGAQNGCRLDLAYTITNLYAARWSRAVGKPLMDLPAPRPEYDEECAYDTDPAYEDELNEFFDDLGRVLEAYVRTLRSDGSRFDLAIQGGRPMSAAATRGAKLFVGRASCNECHSGPTLSDGEFRNVGLAQVERIDRQMDYDEGRCDDPTPDGEDCLDDPSTRGRFKTPPLRDVSLTAPYMHAGQKKTLWDVVEFYRYGGDHEGFPGTPDTAIRPLNLTDQDVDDLVAFLLSLEGGP